MQYSAANPAGKTQKRSNIQTLGIIAGKKKAPVKGPKFILVGGLCSVCFAALVTLEMQRGKAKVDGITRFHKTGEAGSRPVLVLDRDTDHGEFVRVQSGFEMLLFDGDFDDIVK